MTEEFLIGFADAAPVTGDASAPRVRNAPTNFPLLRFGKNAYTIDGEDGSFELDEEAAKAIVDEFNKRGKDLVVDYEHGTLKKDSAVRGEAPASGWIKKLELTPEGVAAAEVAWTDKAKDMLEAGEIRYHSPVIQFDKRTKKPKAVQSVALTTHPAIHGAAALVAASDISTHKEDEMATVKELSDFGREVASTIGELRGALTRVFEELRSRATTDAEIAMFNDESGKLNAIAFGDGLAAVIPVPVPVAEAPAAVVVAASPEDLKRITDAIDGNVDIVGENSPAIRKLYHLHRVLRGVVKDEPFTEKAKSDVDAAIAELEAEKAAIGKANAEAAKAENFVEAKDFSDTEKSVMSMLGLSDLGDMESIKSSIQALSDFKVNTERILAAQKVSTPDELVMKIVASEQALAKKDLEIRDAIALHDARTAVDRAVVEGYITESHRDWAVDFAKRDMKAFGDFVKGVPASMRAPGTIALADQKLNKTTHSLDAPDQVALSDKGFADFQKVCASLGKSDVTLADYKEYKSSKALADAAATTAGDYVIGKKGKQLSGPIGKPVSSGNPDTERMNKNRGTGTGKWNE